MTLFQQRCAELGLANTHQRQVIFRTLAESTSHPTPEEVYRRVRKKIPSISLGTVYRNIKILVQKGLLKEVAVHHEPLRLDPNLSDHHHLVCRRCKSVADIASEDVEPVRLKAALPAGFQVERCEVVAMGLCAACAMKLKQNRSH
ncbi:MAG: transcriptional repressor [Acidobacteria bacterium]|nr:transcriptional repressor [Acidobacteriota bacterium]